MFIAVGKRDFRLVRCVATGARGAALIALGVGLAGGCSPVGPEDPLWTSQYALWNPPPISASLPYEASYDFDFQTHSVGDWNGDGRLDLLLGSHTSATPLGSGVFLLLNTDGEIAPYPSWTQGGAVTKVAFVDWDSDGDLDISVGYEGEKIRIYENQSGLPQSIPAWESGLPEDVSDMAWGDFDVDGDPDLVVARALSDVLYFENTYSLNGSMAVTLPLPWDYASAVAWGDMDGDSDPDLAMAITYNTWGGGGLPGTIRVYENVESALPGGGPSSTSSSGAFELLWASGVGDMNEDTRALAWGDYDGDGDLDIAVANHGEPDIIWQNDGASFSKGWEAATANNSNSVAWGDWDSDGTLDLVVGNEDVFPYIYLFPDDKAGNLPTTPDHVLINTAQNNPGSQDVGMADFDGDGMLELLSVHSGEPSLIYRGDRPLPLPDVVDPMTPPLGGVRDLAWGDVDGDGVEELVLLTATTAGSDVQLVAFENGSPSFTSLGWGFPSQPYSIALGDLDLDGDLDLAVGTSGSALDRVYENDGTGNYALAWSTSAGSDTRDLAWADLDMDGDLDLLRVDFAQGLLVHENAAADSASPPSPPLGAAQTLVSMAESSRVALADYDADGDADIALCGGTVVVPQAPVLYENGTDQLSPSLTFQPLWTAGYEIACSDLAWGDINSDGYMDLLATSLSGPTVIWAGDSTVQGLETDVAWEAVSSSPRSSIAIADIEGDGDLDFAVGGDLSSGSALEVFATAQDYPSPGWGPLPALWRDTGPVTFGDVDADGDLDLVVGQAIGAVNSPLFEVFKNSTVVPPRRAQNPSVAKIVVDIPGGGFAHAGRALASLVAVDVTLVDPEWDRVWDYHLEYSDGRGGWTTGTLTSPATGPLSGSPAGVNETLVWDAAGDGLVDTPRCAILGRACPTRDGISVRVVLDQQVTESVGLSVERGAVASIPVTLGLAQCYPFDADFDGVHCSEDCDDNDENNFPGNTEVCDGQDNDCDGLDDAGQDGEAGTESDLDGDGYVSCSPAIGGLQGGDCDDGDSDTYPGNLEVCDGQDNDCLFGDDAGSPGTPGQETDDDGDGQWECQGDCDDTNPANFLGNLELCDGQDNDCNGMDDFGNQWVTGQETDLDEDGVSVCQGDCDDADPVNFPGNTELCDGQDNDCVAGDDAGSPGNPGQETDDDGDGQWACAGDCDAQSPEVFLGNIEVCDGQDNDCNGLDDFGAEGLAGQEVDLDADGHWLCADCDDSDSGVHPSATELCDAIDQDCDGSLVGSFEDIDSDGVPNCVDDDADGDSYNKDTDCDDEDPTVHPLAKEFCDLVDSDCNGSLVDEFEDLDFDGVPNCEDEDKDGDDFVPPNDCDDLDVSVYPGAVDWPGDGIDQDCSGTDTALCYADEDGDGFGGSVEVSAADGDCTSIGAISSSDDCNDSDPHTHPGAEETCDDDKDQDCDGSEVEVSVDPDCWPGGFLSCSSSLAASRPGEARSLILLGLAFLLLGLGRRRCA